MNKNILYTTFIFLFNTCLFSQTALKDSSNFSDPFLVNVYKNLEVKANGYNDLCDTWQITDPNVVRRIYNQLVRHNYLYVNSKHIEDDKSIDSLDRIFENERVIIKCRKRYFDDEIMYLQFINDYGTNFLKTKEILDPIYDWVIIRDALGIDLYEKIKRKVYTYNSLKKDFFETRTSYCYDLYFNAFNPDFMFWNTSSNSQNKYLGSFFGKWGNDCMSKPGWYYPDYILGGKVAYLDSLTNDKDDYAYSVSLGSGAAVHEIVNSNKTLFKKRGLTTSSSNFYIQLSGNPFLIFTKKWRYFHLNVEAYIDMTDKDEHDFDFSETALFYSVKNYTTVSVSQKNLWTISDFGNLYVEGGMHFHDLVRYLYTKDNDVLGKFGPVKKNTVPFAVVGVTKDGGLFQHSLLFQVNYNTQEQLGYWGIKAMLSIRSAFGVDVRYFSTWNKAKLSYWQNDSYFVISPFIRINY